ncbi:hypothetical protein PCANC_25228 [Puccinia coronata f. sp. avenae]|uniref:Uncharacterized protein n=1 Tax=Puccinia coronata f. sp. avenae TaxID=200324 RepID=A0A2N5TKE5_9BASI|nr:hypothetical protein PCANC_25228 [Puccinia coronata f. sp. avenae]
MTSLELVANRPPAKPLLHSANRSWASERDLCRVAPTARRHDYFQACACTKGEMASLKTGSRPTADRVVRLRPKQINISVPQLVRPRKDIKTVSN